MSTSGRSAKKPRQRAYQHLLTTAYRLVVNAHDATTALSAIHREVLKIPTIEESQFRRSKSLLIPYQQVIAGLTISLQGPGSIRILRNSNATFVTCFQDHQDKVNVL